MKKILFFIVALGLVFNFLPVVCAEDAIDADIVETSMQVIEAAKSLETTQQKIDYLVEKAQGFFDSEMFQEVVDTAQYILTYLDKDSLAAGDLLTKATDALASKAKGSLGEAVKKFGF